MPPSFSDALRDPRMLLAGVAVIVVAGIAIVAAFLVVPTLSRVDRVMDTVEQTLPVIEEIEPQVDTIQNDVDTITPDVDDIGGDVGGMREELGAMRGDLTTLEQMDARLAALQEQMQALDTLAELPGMGQRLRETRDAVRSVDADLSALRKTIHGMSHSLTSVDRSFDEVVALLEKTAEHAENLDHKSGPPPPGSPPWAR